MIVMATFDYEQYDPFIDSFTDERVIMMDYDRGDMQLTKARLHSRFYEYCEANHIELVMVSTTYECSGVGGRLVLPPMWAE